MSKSVRYTQEEYKYARIYRDRAYPSYETEYPWSTMKQSHKDNWAYLYVNRRDRGPEGIMEEIHKLQEEEKKLTEAASSYSFVSAEEDIDFVRILKETPKGTPYILVETRTRNNQAKEWYLFIHKSILGNSKVKGQIVGNTQAFSIIKTIGKGWGHGHVAEVPIRSYRVISGDGAIPGYIKKAVDNLKLALNPKDTVTFVQFL